MRDLLSARSLRTSRAVFRIGSQAALPRLLKRPVVATDDYWARQRALADRELQPHVLLVDVARARLALAHTGSLELRHRLAPSSWSRVVTPGGPARGVAA